MSEIKNIIKSLNIIKEEITKNMTKDNMPVSVGSGAGAAIGAGVGTTILPGAGTIIGALVGTFAGTLVGLKIKDKE